MSNWSNRFASILMPALLAACGSTPSSAQPPSTAQPAAAAQPPAAAVTPISDRAAQQYAQAMQLMKAGRTADAEVQFKQLSLAYPEFAGPQINLGLLYLKESQLAEAEAITGIVCVQNLYNLAQRNDDGFIDDLARRGIAYVPFFPLGASLRCNRRRWTRLRRPSKLLQCR